MVVPGDLVGSRYAIEALLANGGMADVYRAQDVALRRPVAVKAFRSGDASPTDAHRFERETQLLAELDHRNLVRLLDAGHDDGVPFLVLELIDGPTLRQRLGHGPLSPTEAQQIGGDIARALAYVHAQGVVHRDVKPSNILLAAGGRAVLSDFGIAQPADGTRLTAARATVGTAAYLAPEQVSGRPVTGAADVYALGLVLTEALSGERPFEGTQHEMVAARMAHDPPIPPVLPPSWVRLLRAMTRRDPTARPDAAIVADHLSAPALADLANLADEPPDTQELRDLDLDGVATATAALPAVPVPAAAAAGPAAVGHRVAGVRSVAGDRLPVGWLAALVPVLLLAAFLLFSSGDGDQPREEADSSRTAPTVAVSTSTSAATTTVPSTTVPATPTTLAVQPVSQAATCADIEAQKQALDDEKQRIDEAYRHDRETRQQLRDDLDARKQALDEQKSALHC